MKYILYKIFKRMGYYICLHNVCRTTYKKNALLCYIQESFLQDKIKGRHQAFDQIITIAKALSDNGYNVDVIDYRAYKVKLNKCYDAVFDICVKSPSVYDKNVDDNTKRIVYFTGSESVFANNAELERINDVKKRRGVSLKPRRQAPLISPEIENFDMAIMIGSEYNFATYNSFKIKKHVIVPNTGYKFNFTFDNKIKKTTNFLFLEVPELYIKD